MLDLKCFKITINVQKNKHNLTSLLAFIKVIVYSPSDTTCTRFSEDLIYEFLIIQTGSS